MLATQYLCRRYANSMVRILPFTILDEMFRLIILLLISSLIVLFDTASNHMMTDL